MGRAFDHEAHGSSPSSSFLTGETVRKFCDGDGGVEDRAGGGGATLVRGGAVVTMLTRCGYNVNAARFSTYFRIY